MNQSLSVTMVLEGGLPHLYLTVQDTYKSPAQIFSVPLEFTDLDALVQSVRTHGDYWLINTARETPHFQVESPINIRHDDTLIYWDIIFEHYEPFLNVDLSSDSEDYDENVITFTFDAFQYVSALYQAFQLAQQLHPTLFRLNSTPDTLEHPIAALGAYIPVLKILWQKHGNHSNMVHNGEAVHESDQMARQAEVEWLQEILDALDSSHSDTVRENFDAWLETLPDDIQQQLEQDSTPLENALRSRWQMLVDSLTEEEAESLENNLSEQQFPLSLKLRLMKEFLEGNPSVLLGHAHDTNPTEKKVVDLQSWKKGHPEN
ncbi:MAG TPA: hypothetical protein PLB10_05235 [Thiolinea sp.]|nr:hypothetical protein [Thiolinea sp.]